MCTNQICKVEEIDVDPVLVSLMELKKVRKTRSLDLIITEVKCINREQWRELVNSAKESMILQRMS